MFQMIDFEMTFVPVIEIIPWEDFVILEVGPFIICVNPPDTRVSVIMIEQEATHEQLVDKSNDVSDLLSHDVTDNNSHDAYKQSSLEVSQTNSSECLEQNPPEVLEDVLQELSDPDSENRSNIHSDVFFLLASNLGSAISNTYEVDAVAASYTVTDDEETDMDEEADLEIQYSTLGVEDLCKNKPHVTSFQSFDTDSLECVTSHHLTPSVWSEDNSLNVRIDSLSDEVFESDIALTSEIKDTRLSSEKGSVQEAISSSSSFTKPKLNSSFSFDSSKSQVTSDSSENGSFYLEQLIEENSEQRSMQKSRIYSRSMQEPRVSLSSILEPEISVERHMHEPERSSDGVSKQLKFTKSYSLDSNKSQVSSDQSESGNLYLGRLFYHSSESQVDRCEEFILSQESDHFEFTRSGEHSRDGSIETDETLCIGDNSRGSINDDNRYMESNKSAHSEFLEKHLDMEHEVEIGPLAMNKDTVEVRNRSGVTSYLSISDNAEYIESHTECLKTSPNDTEYDTLNTNKYKEENTGCNATPDISEIVNAVHIESHIKDLKANREYVSATCENDTLTTNMELAKTNIESIVISDETNKASIEYTESDKEGLNTHKDTVENAVENETLIRNKDRAEVQTEYDMKSEINNKDKNEYLESCKQCKSTDQENIEPTFENYIMMTTNNTTHDFVGATIETEALTIKKEEHLLEINTEAKIDYLVSGIEGLKTNQENVGATIETDTWVTNMDIGVTDYDAISEIGIETNIKYLQSDKESLCTTQDNMKASDDTLETRKSEVGINTEHDVTSVMNNAESTVHSKIENEGLDTKQENAKNLDINTSKVDVVNENNLPNIDTASTENDLRHYRRVTSMDNVETDILDKRMIANVERSDSEMDTMVIKQVTFDDDVQVDRLKAKEITVLQVKFKTTGLDGYAESIVKTMIEAAIAEVVAEYIAAETTDIVKYFEERDLVENEHMYHEHEMNDRHGILVHDNGQQPPAKCRPLSDIIEEMVYVIIEDDADVFMKEDHRIIPVIDEAVIDVTSETFNFTDDGAVGNKKERKLTQSNERKLTKSNEMKPNDTSADSDEEKRIEDYNFELLKNDKFYARKMTSTAIGNRFSDTERYTAEANCDTNDSISGKNEIIVLTGESLEDKCTNEKDENKGSICNNLNEQKLQVIETERRLENVGEVGYIVQICPKTETEINRASEESNKIEIDSNACESVTKIDSSATLLDKEQSMKFNTIVVIAEVHMDNSDEVKEIAELEDIDIQFNVIQPSLEEVLGAYDDECNTHIKKEMDIIVNENELETGTADTVVEKEVNIIIDTEPKDVAVTLIEAETSINNQMKIEAHEANTIIMEKNESELETADVDNIIYEDWQQTVNETKLDADRVDSYIEERKITFNENELEADAYDTVIEQEINTALKGANKCANKAILYETNIEQETNITADIKTIIEEVCETPRRLSRPTLNIEGFLRTQSEEIGTQVDDEGQQRSKSSSHLSQSVENALQKGDMNLKIFTEEKANTSRTSSSESLKVSPAKTTTTTVPAKPLPAESLSKRFKLNMSADLLRRNEYNRTSRLYESQSEGDEINEPEKFHDRIFSERYDSVDSKESYSSSKDIHAIKGPSSHGFNREYERNTGEYSQRSQHKRLEKKQEGSYFPRMQQMGLERNQEGSYSPKTQQIGLERNQEGSYSPRTQQMGLERNQEGSYSPRMQQMGLERNQEGSYSPRKQHIGIERNQKESCSQRMHQMELEKRGPYDKYSKSMDTTDSQQRRANLRKFSSMNITAEYDDTNPFNKSSNKQHKYLQNKLPAESKHADRSYTNNDNKHKTSTKTGYAYSETENHGQQYDDRTYQAKQKTNYQNLSSGNHSIDQDPRQKHAYSSQRPSPCQNQVMPPPFLTHGHSVRTQHKIDQLRSRRSDAKSQKIKSKSSLEMHRSLLRAKTFKDDDSPNRFTIDSRSVSRAQTFDDYSNETYHPQPSADYYSAYKSKEEKNQVSQTEHATGNKDQYLSGRDMLHNFKTDRDYSPSRDRVDASGYGVKLDNDNPKYSSMSNYTYDDSRKNTNRTGQDRQESVDRTRYHGNMDIYAQVINKPQYRAEQDTITQRNIGSDRNQVIRDQYTNDRYSRKCDESTRDGWNGSSVTTPTPSVNQDNGGGHFSIPDDVHGNRRSRRTYYRQESEENLGRYNTNSGRMKIPGHCDKNQKDGPLSLQDTYGPMDNNDSHMSGSALSQSTNHLSESMISLNQRQAPASSPSRQGTLQKQHSQQSNQSEINGGVAREEVEGIKFERNKNLGEDDLLLKIKEIIVHFEKLEDFHRGDGMRIQKMLGDMYWDYTHLREMIGDCMADNGYAVVSMNMLRTLNSIGIFKNDDVWFPTYYTYNTMWNFTDASSKLAKALSDNDAVRLLTMNCGHRPYINAIHSKNVYYVIKASLSILQNIARNSGMKHLFDENKTSETIMPFLESEDEMLKILATLTIANIVDEEGNKTMIADTGTIHSMVNWLEKAISLPRRRYKGFTPQELTEGLNKLAVNDNNKTRIVDEGALPLFLKMLQHDDIREQSSAARVIWTLSFDKDVRQKIKDFPELVPKLEKYTESTNKSLQMNAHGALWVIRGDNDVSRESRPKSVKSKVHVMLSYAWSDKETVMAIRDRLRAEGYAIWIDVEKMGGSTLESMAGAVENSAVVLCCMSEKYKQSPNCRTEAEYTFQLRKDYIPIMIQQKYRPDGWLGIILGAKLFFDFSGKYPFEKSFQGLLKELRGRGKVAQHESPSESNDHTDSAIVHSTSSSHSHASLVGTPVHQMPSINSAILNMGQEELIKWLRHVKLTDCIPAFMEFDGKLLMQLKLMRTEAPEFFYQCLEKRLNMSLIEILKFTRALEEL